METFWRQCKEWFNSYFNIYRDSGQAGASVEVYWTIFKGTLLEATGSSFQWTKSSIKHERNFMVE